MCPMVPTFTCGLFRSKFSVAILLLRLALSAAAGVARAPSPTSLVSVVPTGLVSFISPLPRAYPPGPIPALIVRAQEFLFLHQSWETIQFSRRSYSRWYLARKLSKFRCQLQKSLPRYCRDSEDSQQTSVPRWPSARRSNRVQIPPTPKTASKSSCLPSATQNLRSTTNRGASSHLGAVLPCTFAIISSDTDLGASSYRAKCIEYSARPWVLERMWVAYPNISARGTMALITCDPARCSMPSIRPRRELRSPMITPA